MWEAARAPSFPSWSAVSARPGRSSPWRSTRGRWPGPGRSSGAIRSWTGSAGFRVRRRRCAGFRTRASTSSSPTASSVASWTRTAPSIRSTASSGRAVGRSSISTASIPRSGSGPGRFACPPDGGNGSGPGIPGSPQLRRGDGGSGPNASGSHRGNRRPRRTVRTTGPSLPDGSSPAAPPSPTGSTRRTAGSKSRLIPVGISSRPMASPGRMGMVVASPRTGSDTRRRRRPATTLASRAISPVRIWGPSGSRDMGRSEEFRRSRKERSRSPSSVGARWIRKAVTPASASAEIASRGSALGPSVQRSSVRTNAAPPAAAPAARERIPGGRPRGRPIAPGDRGRGGAASGFRPTWDVPGNLSPGSVSRGKKGRGRRMVPPNQQDTGGPTGRRGAPTPPRAPPPRFPSGGGGPTPPPGAPATSGPDAGLGSRSAGGALDPPTFRLRHGEGGDDRSGATPGGGRIANGPVPGPGRRAPRRPPARAYRRTASGS